MTNAIDFASLFDNTTNKPNIKPEIQLDDFTFNLLDVAPVYSWHKTDELKEDGTPKFERSKEPKTDESGEHVFIEISLQFCDANGKQTSLDAPFKNSSHCVDENTLKKLLQMRGQTIKLLKPRIEFSTKNKTSKTGFNSLETVMTFAFDDFDLK